jgi:hypothetical protein
MADGWEWLSPHGKIYTTNTVSYSPRTLTDLAIAEDTRIELADLVASEFDDEAFARAAERDHVQRQNAARRTAVAAVLRAADPAPF